MQHREMDDLYFLVREKIKAKRRPHLYTPATWSAHTLQLHAHTLHNHLHIWGNQYKISISRWWQISLVAQTVKCLPAMQETQVQSLGWEDPLEKEMATHSSTLSWKIPWTQEPGRLHCMGLQRVRYDWATSLSLSLSRWWQKVSNQCPVKLH